MAGVRRFLQRLRNVLSPGRAERELAREMASHLAILEDDFRRQGMTADEARAAARRAMGGVEQTKERHREARSLPLVEDLRRDLGIAVRMLRKAPGFTAVVVLTLGAGIGANTAIFTVVDAVLLRPPPFPHADRLVAVSPRSEESGFNLPFLYKPSALAWREQADFVEDVGLYTTVDMVRTDGESAIKLRAYRLSPSLMRMLEIPPLLGRPILEEDGESGAPEVVLLSEAIWRRDFGADQDVLGRTITLDGLPYTVIGVMPATFRFPAIGKREVWTALNEDHIAAMDDRGRFNLFMLLPEGVGVEAIQDQAGALQAALAEDKIELSGFAQVHLQTMGDWRANPNTERALKILAGAVALIMLVAGLNAANLLLVRGSTRTNEIGVRIALGGSRARVVRQIAVEGVVLALAAGALAVLLAAGTLEAILAITPREVRDWSLNPIDLSTRVMAFTLLLSALAGGLFAVLPALGTVRSGAAMRNASLGAHGVTARTRQVWRGGLVIMEVGLSVILLAGAGLFIKNFRNLVATDLGFEAEGLVRLTPGLIESRYASPEEMRAFYDQLVERVSALPGVTRVSLAGGMPPSSGIFFGDSLVGEDAPRPVGQPDVFPFADVDEAFLDVLGTELLAGRNFSPEDQPEDRVRIVDLEMARFLFGEDAPIGRRFRMGDDGEWQTVIGVVRDLHLNGVRDETQPYEVLRPLNADEPYGYWSLAIRTEGDPTRVFEPIRSIVHDIDPNQPIDRLELVSEALVDALDTEQFLLKLMTIFGGLALTLSALGIFGLVAYVVQRQFREIGIRVALGARRADVRRMVVGRGVRLSLGGVLLGLAGALWLGRYARGLLEEVDPTDPAVLAMTALLAFVTCVAASAVPARRAMLVQPTEILKAE